MFLELRTGINAEKAIILANNIEELHIYLALLINYLNNTIAI